MSSLWGEAVLGMVVGIVTAAVLFVIKKFWDQVIDPAIKARLYRGVDISGQWYGDDETDELSRTTELTCVLTQQAHEVAGTFRIQYMTAEKSFDLSFAVTGYIWEGYVTINLRPSDRKVTSYATCLLKISDGGVALVGRTAYRNVITDNVDSLVVVLLRGTPTSVKQQSLTARRLRKEAQEAQAAMEQENPEVLPDQSGTMPHHQ